LFSIFLYFEYKEYYPLYPREEEERCAELSAALEQRREALVKDAVEGPVNELYQEEVRQRMVELAALAKCGSLYIDTKNIN